jgi:hypothetical protein
VLISGHPRTHTRAHACTPTRRPPREALSGCHLSSVRLRVVSAVRCLCVPPVVICHRATPCSTRTRPVCNRSQRVGQRRCERHATQRAAATTSARRGERHATQRAAATTSARREDNSKNALYMLHWITQHSRIFRLLHVLVCACVVRVEVRMRHTPSSSQYTHRAILMPMMHQH